jgi:hypothetical protein
MNNTYIKNGSAWDIRMRSKVLLAATMMITTFWDVTVCNLINILKMEAAGSSKMLAMFYQMP